MTEIERRPSWPALVAVAVVAAIAGAMLAGAIGGGGSEQADSGPVTTPPPTVGIDLTDDAPAATTAPSPLLAGSKTKLLISEGTRFTVVDLGTGATALVPLPELTGYTEHQPLVVGDRIVIDERYTAYSVDRGFSGEVVELGTADTVVPAGGHEVWLIDQRTDSAVRVSVDGTSRATPITLPDGSWRVFGAAGGLVLSSPRAWRQYDRDGRLVREQNGTAIAGRGDTLAWLDAGCRSGPCDVHVTDVATGEARAHQLTVEPLAALYEAKISPDGRWLALGGDIDDQRQSHEIVLIDLAGDRGLRVVVGDMATPPGVLSWSPDSTWLHWSRRKFGAEESEMAAFGLARSAIVQLEVPVRSVVTFVAL